MISVVLLFILYIQKCIECGLQALIMNFNYVRVLTYVSIFFIAIVLYHICRRHCAKTIEVYLLYFLLTLHRCCFLVNASEQLTKNLISIVLDIYQIFDFAINHRLLTIVQLPVAVACISKFTIAISIVLMQSANHCRMPMQYHF